MQTALLAARGIELVQWTNETVSMAEMVNIHDAKTQFSRTIRRVEAGERVVIARSGKPVADLVPHRGERVRLGGLQNQIWVADDAFTWSDPEIAAMQAARQFPDLSRHDPFDRLILAQAFVEGLTLLTADRILLSLGRPFVHDAGV